MATNLAHVRTVDDRDAAGAIEDPLMSFAAESEIAVSPAMVNVLATVQPVTALDRERR